MKEKWKKYTRRTKINEDATLDFWEVFPKGKWNYAVVLDKKTPLKNQIKIEKNYDSNLYPWQIKKPIISLYVPVREIKNWDLIKTSKVLRGNPKIQKVKEVKGTFKFTPDLPDYNYISKNISKKTEYIKLIPYGATHLRVSIFPVIKK